MLEHLQIEGADGVPLHAVRAGERGRLILFLHGFPEFWQAWHRLLAEFSRDHQVAAIDLRGYNLSGKPAGSRCYGMDKVVEDLRRVLQVLSPQGPVVVVGHDWGGIAGWAFAHAHPERVHQLVIINAPHPSIYRRELRRNVRQLLASSYAGLFQLRGVAELALRARDFAGLKAMIFGTTTKPWMFPPELRAAYRLAWRQPGALTAGLNYYRSPGNLRQLITGKEDWLIAPRTLVLWGERDPALRIENLRGLEAFVPHLTVARHAAASHWIVHEEPEWVVQRIRDFMTAAPLAAPPREIGRRPR